MLGRVHVGIFFVFLSYSRMTRRKFSKSKKKENNENWRNESNYVETFVENLDFEEYYKELNILNPQDFQSFMEYLRTPLPVSFRITGSKKHALQLRDYMKEKMFPNLNGLMVDEKAIPIPKSLDWYPDELAFVFDIGRGELKKCAAAAEFHKFLVAETEVGNICRQEAVSMIPVLFLDINPGQYVMDMCAAPGSKTTQLLEGIMTDSSEFPGKF